jgi:hypothetical protein
MTAISSGEVPSPPVNDAPTFAALYAELYPRMVRLARLSLSDAANVGSAEEIVQDAFVQLFRNWDRVDSPSAWLRIAVMNGCRSWGRHRQVRRRHHMVPAPPVVDDADALAVRDALRAGRRRRLRSAAVSVVVGGSVLATAAGGAAGKLPGGIERAFHRISRWSEPCRVDQSTAQLVASFHRPDGRTVEWWRAMTTRAVGDDARAIADEVRLVNPDGSAHDMYEDCTVDFFPPRLVPAGTSNGNPAEDVTWGEVPPGTTALRAVYRDGAVVDVPLQHGGYFMAGLDRGVGRNDTPLRIEALGAAGTVISSAPEP